ncbi:DNA packaging ATPase [Gluconobacter phage GC1]|uniref:DNA packaging ATPase n=1 Tax=Gluconobacter phage GC1 TaxID=2047788 RepID=A0A2I5AR70_9VIRU|nr:terminase large subunit [Gluconobacter phage GC1]ATS92577.1 DNA packaging ATPase [Gluconobacter phage GC1]
MVNFPDDTKRLVILGMTGSGKSVVGAYHLSRRSFDRMPWVIFDPKRDDLLNSLGAKEIALDEKPPSEPGLYIVHPVPGADDEAVELFLSRVVNRAVDTRAGTGVYFDEGYSIPSRSPSFRRILTQGRSLRVPAITLSQRPVWMDRFVWSESDFVQYMKLRSQDDRDQTRAWLPADIEKPLPKYHSLYYDVAADEVTLFKPVPHPDDIAEMVRKRTMGPKKKVRYL